MVSAITSTNQYPVNYEALEVIRRLQSLGVTPTGNLSIDRQHLQTAELQKRQITLASNSQVNLNRLEGTSGDFATTINFLDKTNRTNQINAGHYDQEIGLEYNTQGTISEVNQEIKANLSHEMTGASQLAELNKLKLGLIA